MMDDMETKAMLSKIWDGTSSSVGGSTNHQRRRRHAGKQPPRRQNSFSRDIGHAAAETYLVTRLSFTLLRYLGYFFLYRCHLAMLSNDFFLLMKWLSSNVYS